MINHLPVQPTIGVFVPSPLGMRVSRTALDDTGVMSNPRFMLVDVIYKRAKPLITCVVPECKCKGLHFRANPRLVAASFPKRKSRSIRSICAVSGNARSLPQRKSSLLDSFLNRLRPRLAGSILRAILHRGVLLSIFYFDIFVWPLFCQLLRAREIHVMK